MSIVSPTEGETIYQYESNYPKLKVIVPQEMISGGVKINILCLTNVIHAFFNRQGQSTCRKKIKMQSSESCLASTFPD